MNCLGERMRDYGHDHIANKSDEELLYNCQDICDDGTGSWYCHELPYHRAFLRACHQEARRRGLKVPGAFNPYGLGT